MPRVGKKKFPYTDKGVAAAKAYAKKNDLPIIYTEDNKAGMAIPNYAEGGGVRFYERKAPAGGGGAPKMHEAQALDFGGGGNKNKNKTKNKNKSKVKGNEEEREDQWTEGCPEGQKPDGQGGCVPIEEEEGDTPCPEGQKPDGQGGCIEEESEEEEEEEGGEEEEEGGEEESGEEESGEEEETGGGTETETETGGETADAGDDEGYNPQSSRSDDGYIPQSTFGEGENPNVGRAEGDYGHESRDYTPATQAGGVADSVSDATSNVGDAASSAGDSISDATSSMAESAGDAFSSAGDNLSDATEGLGDKLGDATEGLGDKLGDATEGLGDKLDEATAKRGAIVRVNRRKAKPKRRYRYGGIRAINKEGRAMGASKEDKSYAKDLYRGASKGQKKQAMQMYRQYKQTGEIPEGAEELYKEAGGTRFAHKGAVVKANKKSKGKPKGMAIVIAIGRPKANRKKR